MYANPNITTEYKEIIKLDYGKEKVYKEDTGNFLYKLFWERDEFYSLRLWPIITLIRDPYSSDDYFKIELTWDILSHNEVTINLNNKKAYTFNQKYSEYKMISINSKDAKIKWTDINKINVGVFAASDNKTILLNRTREINIIHYKTTNNHLLINNEILKFKSINKITILNKDPKDINQNIKYNTVTIVPNILKKQGLWKKIADIYIENDGMNGKIYSNQITNIKLTNLIFSDDNKNINLYLKNNDKQYSLMIDEITRYDYQRKGTYVLYHENGQQTLSHNAIILIMGSVYLIQDFSCALLIGEWYSVNIKLFL